MYDRGAGRGSEARGGGGMENTHASTKRIIVEDMYPLVYL